MKATCWWLGLLALPLFVFGQNYPSRPPTPPTPDIPPQLVTQIVNVDRIPPADPNAVAIGTWFDSSGTQAYDPTDPNADSVYAEDGASSSFEFRFPGLGGDLFTFCAWWTAHPNRATQVPYRLYDNATVQPGASVALYIADQNLNAGQWVKLFDYTTTAVDAVVHLTNENPGVILADAVMATNDPNVAATCADIPGGQPPPDAIDIVVDQNDPGAMATAGPWTNVLNTSGRSFWNDNALESNDFDTPATFEWETQTTVEAGTYDICMWWGNPSINTGSNLIDVEFDGDAAQNFMATADQEFDFGKWVRLGQATTTADSSVRVRITVESTLAVADAIRVTNNLTQCSNPVGPPQPQPQGRNYVQVEDVDKDGLVDIRDAELNTPAGSCINSAGVQIACPTPLTVSQVLAGTGRGVWQEVPGTSSSTTDWPGSYVTNDFAVWNTTGPIVKSMFDAWTGGHYSPDLNSMLIFGGGHNAGTGNGWLQLDFNRLEWPWKTLIHSDNKIPADCRPTQAAGDNTATLNCINNLGYAQGTGGYCDFARSSWYNLELWENCTVNVIDANNIEVSGCGDRTTDFAVGRYLRVLDPFGPGNSNVNNSFGWITSTNWTGTVQEVGVATWKVPTGVAVGFQPGYQVAVLQNPRAPYSNIEQGSPSGHSYDKRHYDPVSDTILMMNHGWGGPNQCHNQGGAHHVRGMWLLRDATSANPQWVDVRHIAPPQNLGAGKSDPGIWWQTAYDMGTDEGWNAQTVWVADEGPNGKLWWHDVSGTGWIDLSNIDNWETVNCNPLHPDGVASCPVEIINPADNDIMGTKATWAVGYWPTDGTTPRRTFVRQNVEFGVYDIDTGNRVHFGVDSDSESCSFYHDTQLTNDMIQFCGGSHNRTMWRFDPASPLTSGSQWVFDYPNGRLGSNNNTNRFYASGLSRRRAGIFPPTGSVNPEGAFWVRNHVDNMMFMRMPREYQWIPKNWGSNYTTQKNALQGQTCTGGTGACGFTRQETIDHLGANMLTYDVMSSVITGPRMPDPVTEAAKYPDARPCNNERMECFDHDQWRGSFGGEASQNRFFMDYNFKLDADHDSIVGNTGGDKGPQSISLVFTMFDPSFVTQKHWNDDPGPDSGFFWSNTAYFECEWFWMGPGGQDEPGCMDDPDTSRVRPDGSRKQIPIAGAQRRTWMRETCRTHQDPNDNQTPCVEIQTTFTHKYININTGHQLGTAGDPNQGAAGVPGDLDRDQRWNSCRSRDPQIILNTTSTGRVFGWLGCPTRNVNWSKKIGGITESEPGGYIDNFYSPGGLIDMGPYRAPGTAAGTTVSVPAADKLCGSNEYDPDCVRIWEEEWFSIQIELNIVEWQDNLEPTQVPYKSYVKVWIATETDKPHTHRDDREWILHTSFPLHVRPPHPDLLAYNPDAGYGVAISTPQQTDRCGGNHLDGFCPQFYVVPHDPIRHWRTREIWSDSFIPRPKWPDE